MSSHELFESEPTKSEGKWFISKRVSFHGFTIIHSSFMKQLGVSCSNGLILHLHWPKLGVRRQHFAVLSQHLKITLLFGLNAFFNLMGLKQLFGHVHTEKVFKNNESANRDFYRVLKYLPLFLTPVSLLVIIRGGQFT